MTCSFDETPEGKYKCIYVAILLLTISVMTYVIIDTIKYNDLLNEQFTINPSFYNREGFAQIKGGERFYKVHEDLENPEGAAELMNKLDKIATAMIQHLNYKYKTDELVSYHIKPEYVDIVKFGIVSLSKNYNRNNLEENIPERSGGDTSYVIDKGTTFAMCLRDPKNDNKLDTKINSLTFVLLHEMTHLFTKTFGHDTLFWNNFRFILSEAMDAGLYTPVNYKKTGSPYCGIIISYSPLFDPKMHDYHK